MPKQSTTFTSVLEPPTYVIPTNSAFWGRGPVDISSSVAALKDALQARFPGITVITDLTGRESGPINDVEIRRVAAWVNKNRKSFVEFFDEYEFLS